MSNEEPIEPKAKCELLNELEAECWKVKALRLKEKFPKLTEKDLELEEGKFEELIDRIHAKVGRVNYNSKEKFHKYINSL